MRKLLSIAGVSAVAVTLALGAVAPVQAATLPASCAAAPVRAECTYPFAFPAATPATPTSDGSLPFLGWEHPGVNADSEKGYRSPDGAYDIYLDRIYAGPGQYTATVFKRGGYLLTAADGSKASGAKTTYTVESSSRFLTPAAPTVTDVAGSANDKVVFPTAVHGAYKVSSITDLGNGKTRFRLAFTPDAGYVLAPTGSWNSVVDGKAVWLIEANRSDIVTPAAPTLDDQPGTKNDKPLFPVGVNGSYKVSSITDMGDGTTRFRLAFTPDAGWKLAATGSWDRVVDGKAVWLLYADRADTSAATISRSTGFAPGLSDTRATGHLELVGTGLHLWTEGSTSTDKVAEYVITNTALTAVGSPALDYTAKTGGKPGFQLVVDFDADGTSDGILVGEDAYGQNWWLSSGAKDVVKQSAPHTGGGNGSNWFGTLDEWSAAFPNAKVVAYGFSLGSGVLGDGTLNAITFGGKTYTFVE